MDGTGSKQNAEIDIIETLFSEPNAVEPKLHVHDDEDLSDGLKQLGITRTFWNKKTTLETNLSEDWHVYAMNWTPAGLTFYVDGREVGSTTLSPQYEMCMLMGIYTNSGDYWAGTENEVSPKDWEIDYVRVYKDANGYAEGTTKPATPAVKEETIRAQKYTGSTGDPAADLGITDLARNATLTVSEGISGNVDNEANINSAGFRAGWSSKDNPLYGAEFAFTWNEVQNVKAVNLYSKFSADQGITGIELWTTTDGSEWTKDGTYKIEWQDKAGAVEYAKVPVTNGDNIKGLKLVVKAANLTWDHYTINKIHIY